MTIVINNRTGRIAAMKPGLTVGERIVAGAAGMISRRGLNATSIRETAKYTGAPPSSTYRYVPADEMPPP
jgi:AcrR family transcriptional regulator